MGTYIEGKGIQVKRVLHTRLLPVLDYCTWTTVLPNGTVVHRYCVPDRYQVQYLLSFYFFVLVLVLLLGTVLYCTVSGTGTGSTKYKFVVVLCRRP